MHMRSTKQKKHTYLRKISIQMPYVHLRTYGHLKLKDSLQIHTYCIFHVTKSMWCYPGRPPARDGRYYSAALWKEVRNAVGFPI